MDITEIMSFIGSEIITPLLVIAVVYLGYFKAKFKGYGEIDAKLQKLSKLVDIEEAINEVKVKTDLIVKFEHQELISEIEKTIANSKNSSEFEYWKKKGDIEKIENFAFRILESSEEVRNSSDNSLDVMVKIYGELFNGATTLNIPELATKHGSLIDSSFVYENDKAYILFKIYFENYRCEKFNEIFKLWLKELLTFNKLNMEYCRSIVKILVNNADIKDASQAVFSVVNKRNSEYLLSIKSFNDATSEVLGHIGMLVNAMSLENQ
jgi:hypothetical protein